MIQYILSQYHQHTISSLIKAPRTPNTRTRIRVRVTKTKMATRTTRAILIITEIIMVRIVRRRRTRRWTRRTRTVRMWRAVVRCCSRASPSLKQTKWHFSHLCSFVINDKKIRSYSQFVPTPQPLLTQTVQSEKPYLLLVLCCVRHQVAVESKSKGNQ
jgi:hypothetical protein